MTAYSNMQEKEFASEREWGYEGVKHQRFVGTGYFDKVTQTIACGASSITALTGSTEAEQFTRSLRQGESRMAADQPIPHRSRPSQSLSPFALSSDYILRAPPNRGRARRR